MRQRPEPDLDLSRQGAKVAFYRPQVVIDRCHAADEQLADAIVLRRVDPHLRLADGTLEPDVEGGDFGRKGLEVLDPDYRTIFFHQPCVEGGKLGRGQGFQKSVREQIGAFHLAAQPAFDITATFFERGRGAGVSWH